MDPNAKPNTNPKKPFFKTGGGLLLLGFLIVSLIGIPLTVYFLQQQQITTNQAWLTGQSASSSCGQDGKAVIVAQFTNTEPAGAQYAMNVTVKDIQTGLTANIGTVNPGETKIGTIVTALTTLNAGGVSFTLSWTDGHAGTDTRSANYPAVAACKGPTNTPVPPTDTPVPPTDTPAPSATDTPAPSATDTPAPSATDTPAVTDTPGPSNTPTVVVQTSTPGPTSTDAPAPSNTITSKPIATIAATGPGNLVIGFGFVGILLTILGGLIFILL